MGQMLNIDKVNNIQITQTDRARSTQLVILIKKICGFLL